MNNPEENTGTVEQNKEAFESWFYDLMMAAGSCLCRDVLRENKKAMFETWLKVKPWRF